MEQHSKHNGWPMHYDDWREEWVYTDTGLSVAETWRLRPCGYCGLHKTEDGHDGCLGTLPSVRNACCGHGVTEEAYLQMEDGDDFRGHDALRMSIVLKEMRDSEDVTGQ